MKACLWPKTNMKYIQMKYSSVLVWHPGFKEKNLKLNWFINSATRWQMDDGMMDRGNERTKKL